MVINKSTKIITGIFLCLLAVYGLALLVWPGDRSAITGIVILFSLPGVFALTELICFILSGERFLHIWIRRLVELLVLVGLPVFFFTTDASENDCCGDSATFAPGHRLSIQVFIVFAVLAYGFSSLRKQIISPVADVLINLFLLSGIVFNIFMAFQLENPIMWGIGNIPVIALFILALAENHQLFMKLMGEQEFKQNGIVFKVALYILKLHPFVKFPVLLVLCLPLLCVLSGLLLLFGQKPNSLICAFTDTYKHGFSQLDYMCDNVQCGEHFLCSVAANGHRKVVKPERYGVRGGGRIICNRQLLVSNAFEELIEEKFPAMHRQIRNQYNKVGDKIHQHYGLFNNKFIADGIYLLMKPAEWFFLLVLYVTDAKPENRIARQYVSTRDRIILKNKSHESIN